MADDGITSSRDLELGLQNVAEELDPATATSSLTPEDLELGQNVANASRSGDPSIADLVENNIQVIISSPDHIRSPSHNEQTDAGVDDPYMVDKEKLHDYACEGNWGSAKFIFDKYPEMMQISLNKEGHTALQLAILNKKRNFVAQMVKRMTTEDLKIQNRYGYTALQIAVNENNIECFLLLVEHMPAEELKIQNNYGYTALHIAVWRNNIDYFQQLLKSVTTEELKIQDKKGNTALHFAVCLNNIDCVKLLVERMTLEELKIQDKDGDTALHIAMYRNNIYCFLLLLERMTKEELKIQNNNGDTALQIAVKENNIECFLLLVERMTAEELKIQNISGQTALHIAMDTYNIDYFQLLVEKMTDEELKIQDHLGNTALHIAVDKNKIDCVQQLVERMTTEDLEIQNRDGDTALHIAVVEDHHDCLLPLVKRMSRKNLEITNNDGNTALHVAMEKYSIECFKLFLKHMTTEGMQIKDKAGNTALHIAARLNKIDFAQLLKERMTPEDLQIQNNNGDTALHVAMRNNNIEFLLLLVKAERMTAEHLQIQNKAGNTALHLAAGLNKNNLERMFFMTISYNIYDVAVKLFDMYPTPLAIARDDEKKLTALHMLAQRPSHEYVIQVKQMEEENTKDALFEKLWTRVRQLGSEKMLDLISNPSLVLFDAVESGNTDIVKCVLDTNPEVLKIKDSTNGRNLLHLAALFREKSIFDFILEIKTPDLLKSEVDNDGNNVLHFAAAHYKPKASDNDGNNVLHFADHYKPKASAKLRPNIEMERDLNWFKRARNKLPTQLMTMKNKDGKTPRDIFYADHSEVCQEVKDAAKGVSDSGMIVATLIVSVAFAAAVSVPGEKTSNWFTVFILADAVALLASATSIICFLSIFTSARSNESEYIISTQPTLYEGLKLVLISVGAMIVAFVAASFLIFEHRSKWAAYVVTSLCGYPIYMFLRLQILSPSDVLHDNYFSGYMYRLFRTIKGRAP